MIYREIDENGYYIRDVELQENTDKTKYILENYGNMVKPKWDGKKWIDENPIDEFKEALNDKLSEVTEVANNIILSRYSALKQRKSMSIMLKLLAKGKGNWDAMDMNTYTGLTQMDDWITNIRTQENNLQNEVSVLMTTDDIKNYKIEYIK